MTAQKEEGDDEDWWLLVDMDDEDDDFGDVIESPPGAADVDASMVAQAGSPVDESNVSVAAGASVGAGGSTPLSSSFSAIDSNEFNPAEVPAIIVNTNEGAARTGPRQVTRAEAGGRSLNVGLHALFVAAIHDSARAVCGRDAPPAVQRTRAAAVAGPAAAVVGGLGVERGHRHPRRCAQHRRPGGEGARARGRRHFRKGVA